MPLISASGNDVLVNTSTANFQLGSRITPLAGGRYMVTWVGPTTAASPVNATTFGTADIRGQIYNADGTPSGGEFVVNTTTAGVQIVVNAVELSDGNIIITWQDGLGTIYGGPTAASSVVRAQEITSTGTPVGSEFQIATGTGSAEFPIVSALGNGGYVVVWQAGRSGNVMAQIYDGNNATVGSAIVVDNAGMSVAAVPSVATLTNGSFVVAWSNMPPSSIASYRVFGADGTPITSEGSGGFTTSGGGVSNVIALTGGHFVVGYSLVLQSEVQLHTAVFAPDGEYLIDQVVAVEPLNNATRPSLVA